MLFFAFLLVIANANGIVIPSWGWVLFGIQAFLEIVSAVAKALKD